MSNIFIILPTVLSLLNDLSAEVAPCDDDEGRLGRKRNGQVNECTPTPPPMKRWTVLTAGSTQQVLG